MNKTIIALRTRQELNEEQVEESFNLPLIENPVQLEEIRKLASLFVLRSSSENRNLQAAADMKANGIDHRHEASWLTLKIAP